MSHPGGWILVESGQHPDEDCPAVHCVVRATWFATQEEAVAWWDSRPHLSDVKHLVPCSEPSY